MIEEQIREKFMQGYDCSQVVLTYFADRYGLDEELANKISACFGGGMQMGGVCGAFTGALMVIGLKYGHSNPDNLMEQKELLTAKNAEFREKFQKELESCGCKELLGYDVSTPEGFTEALESGRLLGYCPGLVLKVIEILESVL